VTEELPTEAFYDLTTVPGPVDVSPDGERVAFVAAESDPDEDERRRSVFVVSTDGSRLAVVMAREEDVELTVGCSEERGDGDDESDGSA
jgi:hypothetical protein